MRRSRATSTAERPEFPIEPPHYRFVGGKGGVGKTTCAAAMAVRAAAAGFETLVISIDPAPSLGDVFRQRLGSTPQRIPQRQRLHAFELDSARALEDWLEPRRSILQEIALRGTWLDHDDVARLLKLSLPGIDEVAALLQIAALASHARFERIIVDTAPTGHLLRMLALPEVLRRFANAFDGMQVKHRVMVEALRGKWSPDAADVLIDEIRTAAQTLKTLLRDSRRARVSWITLAEQMAVEETLDAVRWLKREGITVDEVIVNRVTTRPPEPCHWCSGRRSAEGQAVNTLRGTLRSTVRIRSLPAAGSEPRGVSTLGRIGKMIEVVDRSAGSSVPRPVRPITAAMNWEGTTVQFADVVPPGTRLVMLGGKGGVGKTTCAAALAIDVATRSKRSRVLLLSTDPAHSLADVLGQRVSDVPRRIRRGPRNLWVRELNTERVFNDLRVDFATAVDGLFLRLSGGDALHAAVATHDREVMRNLIELAPPGIDELVAMMEVTETLADEGRRSRYDLIVMDTAPTGHALRLIEMPALVHQWVKAIMVILLKYQRVVTAGDLAAMLVRLSKQLGRLREILGDPVRTRFVAVTRAAALPRVETLRLLERLRLAHISAPVIIINAVGSGTCSRCQADATVQKREVASTRKELSAFDAGSIRVLLTPAQVPPPQGRDRLRAWRMSWLG